MQWVLLFFMTLRIIMVLSIGWTYQVQAWFWLPRVTPPSTICNFSWCLDSSAGNTSLFATAGFARSRWIVRSEHNEACPVESVLVGGHQWHNWHESHAASEGQLGRRSLWFWCAFSLEEHTKLGRFSWKNSKDRDVFISRWFEKRFRAAVLSI